MTVREPLVISEDLARAVAVDFGYGHQWRELMNIMVQGGIWIIDSANA